jgi:YVTN family beta-propeller protein
MIKSPMFRSKFQLVVLCGLFFTSFISISSQKASESSAFRIYVTNERSGDLSVIDSSTFQVIATVPLGKRPRGIHAGPDHRFLYIALSGSPLAGPGVDESKLPPADKTADGIGVFDVQQNKLVRTIQSGSDPENFDITKDGRTIIVSNEDDSKASFIDIAAGKVTKTVPTGEEPEGVKVSPNGKFVYVTSENNGTISAIDVATAKLIKTFKVGHRPRSVAFLPDSSRAYVNAENDGAVTVVDALKHETIQTIAVGKPGVIKPMCVVLSRDGSTLYVSTGRGHKVFVIDTASNRVTGSVEVGERPWGIELSPDGKTLFSANGPSNDVSEVNLANLSVTKKVKVSDGPWGVAVVPR